MTRLWNDDLDRVGKITNTINPIISYHNNHTASIPIESHTETIIGGDDRRSLELVLIDQTLVQFEEALVTGGSDPSGAFAFAGTDVAHQPRHRVPHRRRVAARTFLRLGGSISRQLPFLSIRSKSSF